MTTPQVAVVVPTWQRAAKLPRLVAALERQRGLDNFEVIIVDDASTDDTQEVVRRLSETSSISLKSLALPANSGPATARNTGWRAARAPVVAFTDDDCIPTDRWLSAILDAMRDADMVQGRTVPDPESDELQPLSRTMEVGQENGLYETCNMAYRREVLERVDGFDERFRYPYGEDADLGWRARATGARAAFCSNAVVYHEVANPGFGAHLRELKRLDGAVLLLKLHPEARAYLWRGMFFRRTHPSAAAAGFGLTVALAPRLRWQWRLGALTLCMPWLSRRLRSEPVRGGLSTQLSVLPKLLISDLAQIAVLTKASVRHRVLVL